MRIATHPVTFGVSAGLSRWIAGGHEGGWRHLLGQLFLSAFVAIAAALYLAEEVMGDGKRLTFVILIAFVARDLLMGIISIALQFRSDPLGIVQRVREALRGEKK